MVKTRSRTRLAAASGGLTCSPDPGNNQHMTSSTVIQKKSSQKKKPPVVAGKRRLDDEDGSQLNTKNKDSNSDEQRQSSSAMPELLLLDQQMDASTSKTTKPARENNSSASRDQLSSSLDPGLEEEELYFDLSAISGGNEKVQVTKPAADPLKELMKKSVLTSDFEKKDSAPPLKQPYYKLQKLRKAERERTTGGQWFDMAAPEVTPELRNDLKVLQMRNVLDRSHHYKASDWKKGKLPKYFQVGTVVSGAAEFYSARIPKKQRKRTIVEELLADEQRRRYYKRKCAELQHKSQSGTQRYHQMKRKLRK